MTTEYAREQQLERALREMLRERDEARELLTMRLENMNRNGKTILDFYAVWLRQARDRATKAEAALLALATQDDARLALASALDRALTCWRDPEMRASAHFDAAMDELARLSTPADG
jgi:hypothetical protein